MESKYWWWIGGGAVAMVGIGTGAYLLTRKTSTPGTILNTTPSATTPSTTPSPSSVFNITSSVANTTTPSATAIPQITVAVQTQKAVAGQTVSVQVASSINLSGTGYSITLADTAGHVFATMSSNRTMTVNVTQSTAGQLTLQTILRNSKGVIAQKTQGYIVFTAIPASTYASPVSYGLEAGGNTSLSLAQSIANNYAAYGAQGVNIAIGTPITPVCGYDKQTRISSCYAVVGSVQEWAANNNFQITGTGQTVLRAAPNSTVSTIASTQRTAINNQAGQAALSTSTQQVLSSTNIPVDQRYTSDTLSGKITPEQAQVLYQEGQLAGPGFVVNGVWYQNLYQIPLSLRSLI